ncbi:MAG TPA: polymer-forming cytoskeletal protein [Pyrinomonadaceae bacterium]
MHAPGAPWPRAGITPRDSQAEFSRLAERFFTKSALTLLLLLLAAAVVNGRDAAPNEELVIDGRQAGDVFGVGRSVRVRGDVRGVIAFGGDVVVEGRVEGDAAAVGGSVILLDGSHVGGDVIVFGGEYRNEGGRRGGSGKTLMYAGYEQELRELARNPASVLTPEFSLAFVGWRLMAVLFWFVVSIALTAVSPGAVGRAAARLQLTLPRVALIGLVGALVLGPGVTSALHFLPPALAALVGVTALLLVLLSYLFGRVVIHAATGRWLQRVLLAEGRRSESVALLLGAAFWAVVLALPYVWPFVVISLVVLSLGLSLTARYRMFSRQ